MDSHLAVAKEKRFFFLYIVTSVSVAHFLSPYKTKCPWDQILTDTVSLRSKNSRTTDMQKTKSVGVNKTWQVEIHITDNQSWNSCHKLSPDHGFTFGSAIEPTKKKHNALWPWTAHGHLLQPKHGASAVRRHWSTRPSFVLTWGLNFVGK